MSALTPSGFRHAAYAQWSDLSKIAPRALATTLDPNQDIVIGEEIHTLIELSSDQVHSCRDIIGLGRGFFAALKNDSGIPHLRCRTIYVLNHAIIFDRVKVSCESVIQVPKEEFFGAVGRLAREEAIEEIQFPEDFGMIASGTDYFSLLSRLDDTIQGETGLMWALRKGHTRIAHLLIQAGSPTGVTGADGMTPLLLAALKGSQDLVELLVVKGKREETNQALKEAARTGQFELVEALLAAKAPPNIQVSEGWTPMMHAADRGHLEIVRLFLAYGAAGDQALLFAAEAGHSSVARYLMIAGIDPEVVNASQWTPLMLSAMNGHLECVRVLVEGGADLYPSGSDNSNAFLLAVMNGHYEIARLLIKVGGERSQGKTAGGRDFGMREALVEAAGNNHLELLRFLQGEGAAVDGVDSDGWTPLSWAAANGSLGAIAFLLEEKAGKETKNGAGMTPLMVAAQYGQLDAVKVLLAAKADVHTLSDTGLTASTYARLDGHEHVRKVLSVAGGSEIPPAGHTVKKIIPRKRGTLRFSLEGKEMLPEELSTLSKTTIPPPGPETGYSEYFGSHRTPRKKPFHRHVTLLNHLLNEGPGVIGDDGSLREQLRLSATRWEPPPPLSEEAVVIVHALSERNEMKEPDPEG